MSIRLACALTLVAMALVPLSGLAQETTVEQPEAVTSQPTGAVAIAEEPSDDATQEALQAAYQQGFDDGYTMAMQQAYEAQLRTLYAEREALATSQAPQEEVQSADAALAEALVAIEEEYQALYFEALEDLAEQNEAYWSAMEAAVYQADDSTTEVVYTYAGVPAYYAPLVYDAVTEIPPPVVPSVVVDDIVNNIYAPLQNPEELQQLAHRLRQEQLANLRQGPGGARRLEELRTTFQPGQGRFGDRGLHRGQDRGRRVGPPDGPGLGPDHRPGDRGLGRDRQPGQGLGPDRGPGQGLNRGPGQGVGSNRSGSGLGQQHGPSGGQRSPGLGGQRSSGVNRPSPSAGGSRGGRR